MVIDRDILTPFSNWTSTFAEWCKHRCHWHRLCPKGSLQRLGIIFVTYPEPKNTVFFPPVFCEALNMLANLESTVCPLSYITFVQNCERFFWVNLRQQQTENNEVLFEYPPLTLKMARCYLVPRLVLARKTNGGREVFWSSSPIWRKRKQSLQSMVFGFHVPNFSDFGGFHWGFWDGFFLSPANLFHPGFEAISQGSVKPAEFSLWDVTFPGSPLETDRPWKMPGTLRSKSCGPTQPA